MPKCFDIYDTIEWLNETRTDMNITRAFLLLIFSNSAIFKATCVVFPVPTGD